MIYKKFFEELKFKPKTKMITTLIQTINKKEEKFLSKPMTDEEIKRDMVLRIIKEIEFEELEKIFKFGFSEDDEYKRFSVQLETKD